MTMWLRAATAGVALLVLSAAAPGPGDRSAELASTKAEARANAAAVASITERIAAAEPRVAAIRAHVLELDRRRQAQRAQLAAQQTEVARLLAALQTLSQRPRLLLLAQPQSAIDAARVSLMLDALVPRLRARTAALRAQIERTAATRRELVAERARLDEVQARLAIDRRRLEAAGAALASRVATLEALLDELAVREPAAPPRIAMAMPASGRLVSRFGSANELGVTLQGVRWRTAAGAEIAAPADGRVAFTGLFRTYGRIVIIEHGEHLLSLLAGLESAGVTAGEAVRAGQPVGRMGPAEPTLYFEVRSGGEPVDPLPLLAEHKSSQG